MSPVLDNLTSAMLMANVAFTVERKNIKFLIPTSVGIILASNAGGAWSPFGDITLLMLWVADKIPTAEFVKSLAAPAIVCWIIFTMLTVWFVPKGCPGNGSQESLNVRKMKPGAYRAMICFLLTIGTGVCFHHFFHLPPYLGMLCGLTYLAKSFFMKDKRRNGKSKEESISKEVDFNALHFICGIPNMMKLIKCKEEVADDDENDEEDNIVSRRIKRIEFDALLFICGVLPMIGGLEYIGFFETVVGNLYDSYSHTAVNISMGAFSALFGSVPVVYAVLNIDKLDMNLLQWLLFALSTGIGCNLLPIGSVAGVAVMSISKGVYRFRTHLPYIPFIIISCAGSIALLLFLSKY
jgi:Na+/H+ antiporter NhaD/arsenite permease-like protein